MDFPVLDSTIASVDDRCRIKDKRASTRQEMIGKLASLYESYISRK
jgi:hypothetical protein